MALLNNVRRINAEDYQADHRQTVSTLARVVNSFMDDVVDNVNGNLTTDNLDRSIVTFDVIVGTDGRPLNVTRLNAGKERPSGLNVVRVRNKTNSAIYPDGAAQISFSELANNLVNVDHITGLQAGFTWTLTVEVL
jgi:hypothetical protein